MASVSKGDATSRQSYTYTPQEGGQTLLSWLQGLHSSFKDHPPPQKCNIILDSISTAKSAYSNWQDICAEVSKLLVKPHVQNVIIPPTLVNMIVGKCGNVLKSNILEHLPKSVEVYGHTVALKSLMNVTVFTSKIICADEKQSEETRAVNFLKTFVDRSVEEPISPSLSHAIIRAYKFTKKAFRKGWHKKDTPDLNDSKDSDENSSDNDDDDRTKNGNNLTGNKSKFKHLPKTEPLPAIGKKTQKCYICKQRYLKRKRKTATPQEKQYPRLCTPCVETNYSKRSAKTDLTGKYAVVTGGRIKIGFEIVLKLLRDGCSVIATTRFPRNAAREFSKQKDYGKWKDRLKIYPLDFKDVAGIYRFVAYVKSTFPHLDILINNAAQTLRRPMDFYRELLDLEQIPFEHIPALQQSVLASKASLDYGCGTSGNTTLATTSKVKVKAITDQPNQTLKIEEVNDDETESPTVSSKRPHEFLAVDNEDEPLVTKKPKVECLEEDLDMSKTPEEVDQSVSVGDGVNDVTNDSPMKEKPKIECLGEDLEADKPELKRSNSEPCSSKQKSPTIELSAPTYTKPGLSQQKSLGPLCAVSSPQVHGSNAVNPFSLSRFFPRGLYDDDGQQLDLRRHNTWRSVLQNVSLGEFMEVFVVNTVAPFILNKELKSHLRKKKEARKFIVNVSAMEGQFNRKGKNKFHPHTNMAKAALNMMTRTAALEYVDCDIYMTSVDTGWVSDERPFHLAKREEKKGFRLPLDCIDGAARVYDPIVTGYNSTEKPQYAVFLKDYNVYPW